MVRHFVLFTALLATLSSAALAREGHNRNVDDFVAS
jgi:hypothetical protein